LTGVAKAKRKQKLKVYCTPIGFHDALVAAPSQKAALEAWGAGTNLFSQGSAHVITDAKLTKVPLEHPGQVVKVPRGTRAEQLAAIEKQVLPKRSNRGEPEILPERSKPRARKPSNSALKKAEEALEKLKKSQAEQRERLETEREALERKLRELKRRHERERDQAQKRVGEERSDYEEALSRYESG
jgi:hypothetical protein